MLFFFCGFTLIKVYGALDKFYLSMPKSVKKKALYFILANLKKKDDNPFLCHKKTYLPSLNKYNTRYVKKIMIIIISVMDDNDDQKITQNKSYFGEYKDKKYNETSTLYKDIITQNYNTLRKTKGFPSVTNLWSNSIYSFNKNYLKNIPAVDNIVNKIIKSFFTINALANNPNGRKLRLVQKRYKKLSLNKILVSKSEIKHSNDKVFITVYLFNKKKRSLLLKLKNLYNSLSLKKTNSITSVLKALPLKSKIINKHLKASPKRKKTSNTLLNSAAMKNQVLKANKNYSKHSSNKSKVNIKKPLFLLNKAKVKTSKMKFIIWKKFNNKLNVMENNITYNDNFNFIVYKLKMIKSNFSSIKRNKTKIRKLRNKMLFKNYAFIAQISNKHKKFILKKNKGSVSKLNKAVKENNEYFVYYKRKLKIYVNFKGKYKVYFRKRRNKIIDVKYSFLNNFFLPKKFKKFKSKKFLGRSQGFKKKGKNRFLKKIFKNKILYYNKLKKLTRYNLHEFIVSYAGPLNKLSRTSQKNMTFSSIPSSFKSIAQQNNIKSSLKNMVLANPKKKSNHNNIVLPSMQDLSLLFVNKDLDINLKNLCKHVNKYKLYCMSSQSLNNQRFNIISNLVSNKSNLLQRKPGSDIEIRRGKGYKTNKTLKFNNLAFSPRSKSYVGSLPYATRQGLYSIKGGLKASPKKSNYSIYKLKSLNKLFTLYNNINLLSAYEQNFNDITHLDIKEQFSKKVMLRDKDKNSADINRDSIVPSMNNFTGMPHIYSKKILLNTYKLLRKSYIKFAFENKLNNNNNNSEYVENNRSVFKRKKVKYNKKNFLRNQTRKNLNVFNSVYMKRYRGKTLKHFTLKFKRPFTRKLFKNSKRYISLKKTMYSEILLNKFNRIDRFFNKYKKIFLDSEKAISLVDKDLNQANVLYHKANFYISPQIISTYKINFINEILEKELLYIYYLKLLSYNNAIFKNWFTYSLKNLISKIYNKKVIFNFINLKYIHLNSDILSQAVNIRLRNFKKNKVVKVLKKVIKLVPISKVNVYACDEHSYIYKYVNNFYNKYIFLKKDIFKELGLINSEKVKSTSKGLSLNLSHKNKNATSIFLENNLNSSLYKNKSVYKKLYTSCKIRRLNLIQANTINFIKYKSVFGVRFEAAGRLTKRSTASRSIFKFRYKGTLRDNPSIILNNSLSSLRLKNNRISNLQFTKIASKTRNGSFGLKGWINNN